ncbi:HNH endonuclease signature motif containing protein [Microbacterium sp. SLBN-146]|uniref:HNH endonuclease signature motif containing protein n=1 Tax=Microbacterium sp. SLBN-146 TaxID=2768457 RepID=UPI001152D6AD|nr:HNH endonuclease signature motif containing protein [Microbacterium sp. SLBN-146]
MEEQTDGPDDLGPPSDEVPGGFDDPFVGACECDACGTHGEGGFDPPDAVDRVSEISNYLGSVVADRLVAVAAMRREVIAVGPVHASLEIMERSVRLELAATLRITEYSAGELLALAEAVVDRYPAIRGAIARADMTEQHAKILVAGTDSVDPLHRAFILERGMELAKHHPVGQFRRHLARLIESVRETTLAQRHEAALADRRVAVEPGADGMAWLHLYAPAVEIHAIHGRMTAIAKQLKKQPDEARTLDHLRADVACDLLIDGAAEAHPAPVRGIRASVVVTVPALALLGDGEAVPPGCDPASVEGVGPIPLTTARRLCGGSGGWMRVLTHPETGMVLSVGRDRYQPPPELAKLVRWRAERCMAPGCEVPASRCQVDHSIAWQHGGSTALSNLGPLCQGHHTVKHHGGWSIRQLDGGAIEWTSPTGRQYVVQPERRVPVFRPTDAGAG